ncbi:hypothetical protein HD806DRAFT_548207 [Xylariaceae sp. AK1471]|nr:hypothetical protein HD806DRAFT_548207 [Xylariaceae sp. AK1471]
MCDYFRQAREIAQQRLFSQPALEAKTQEKLREDIANDSLYHEARRDDNVLVFQLSEAYATEREAGGVYQFGVRPDTRPKHADGTRNENRKPRPTLACDSAPFEGETDEQQLVRQRLCRGALSACTELSTFLLPFLDTDLAARYASIADVVRKHTTNLHPHPHPHPQSNPASLREHVHQHRERRGTGPTGWQHGLAARMPPGDYKGRDALFRELGLGTEARPESTMLYCARELWASKMKFTGRQTRRFDDRRLRAKMKIIEIKVKNCDEGGLEASDLDGAGAGATRIVDFLPLAHPLMRRIAVSTSFQRITDPKANKHRLRDVGTAASRRRG